MPGVRRRTLQFMNQHKDLIEQWISKLSAPGTYLFTMTAFLREFWPADEKLFSDEELQTLRWVSSANQSIQQRRNDINKTSLKHRLRETSDEFLITGDPAALAGLSGPDLQILDRIRTATRALSSSLGREIVAPILARAYGRVCSVLGHKIEELRNSETDEAERLDIVWRPSFVLDSLIELKASLDQTLVEMEAGHRDLQFWAGGIHSRIGVLEEVTGADFTPGTFEAVRDLRNAEGPAHINADLFSGLADPDPQENLLGSF